MRRMTCLACPSGCQLILEGDTVTGYRCPRGERYAREEALTPRRFLTTTLPISGGDIPRIPVKSKEKVPLERVPDLLTALAHTTLQAPITIREVVARLPEEIIATRSVKALLVLGVLMIPAPAQAWMRHDLLTRHSLAQVVWLDKYNKIPVTAYKYQDKEPLNPNFKPRYLDKKPGQMTSARDILIHYSDEPDWNMDKGLELSRFQSLMGGSQGYRHQRYRIGPFVVGEAVDRCNHFYLLSQEAFKKGDRYWGFRFLARSLHYLEDLGEPLHTKPLLFGQIAGKWFMPANFIPLATNLHLSYETYVAKHLAKRDNSGNRFAESLRKPGTAELWSVQDGAIALADYANSKAPALLEANEAHWSAKTKKRKKFVSPSDEEVFPQKRTYWQACLDNSAVETLLVTGRINRGFLELARKEVIEKPIPQPEE